MMLRAGGVIFAGCLLLLSLSSCVILPSTSEMHDLYVQEMRLRVGMSIDDPPRKTWADPDKLVTSRSLPNGNIENEYRFYGYHGTCRSFYEINPKTRIIVGWRYEGRDQDCAMIP